MNLQSMKFCRFKGKKYEWSIEGKPIDGVFEQWVTLKNINLIVGKNATGKSKSINAIRQIADLLAGNVKLTELIYNTATYHLLFKDNKHTFDYFLEYENAKVIQEILTINNDKKLDRKEGLLYYEEVKDFLSFQMDDDKLAVSRVDNKQQPFFQPLHDWGKYLTHYRFGGQLGKDSFLRDINSINENEEIELKDGDSTNVAEVFIRGDSKFEDFSKYIIEDMARISYNIAKISTEKARFFPVPAFGLGVQEEDIDSVTDQREMSQGMFRALSLLVQLNYSLLSKTPSCILIDDIGEGLDYERSKSLINLIIEKVQNSPVQVIMTTNDRFVMNNIPLEYWSVIHRIPKKSLFYNYENSKQVFDEFKFTGLSNFDFLSSEFYFEGFTNEEKA